MKLEEVKQRLKLEKHPEGGYFKEVYRSGESIDLLSTRFNAPRSISTSIYYLLNENDKSHFHSIKSDEIWHYYHGSSALIHMIDLEGRYISVVIGNDLANNECFQFTIPQGVWFAAELLDKNRFGLFGCTVAPGFDFRDFELAKAEELIRICPSKSELIRRFCLG